MTPEALARLHGLCFQTPRPWSAAEFTGFLKDPHCQVLGDAKGFALIRIIAGECELLTIAVDPDMRGQGYGRSLMDWAVAQARSQNAERMFLEVAATNLPALALYHATGFSQCGRRPKYYQNPDGTREDALILALDLGESLIS